MKFLITIMLSLMIIAQGCATDSMKPTQKKSSQPNLSKVADQETLIIPNDKPVKIKSSISLKRGALSTIRASGVVSDWMNQSEGVDAVWCYLKTRCGENGLSWNQLRINGKGMAEIANHIIPYNPKHVYTIRYKGEGKPLTLWMHDAQGSSGDNSGVITVDIFQ